MIERHGEKFLIALFAVLLSLMIYWLIATDSNEAGEKGTMRLREVAATSLETQGESGH